ncbi:MAG: hypothetical protein B6D39_01425 [Anaerolineae bacterium UTCFX2]|jgi:glyoxylase-like metal-dependent hydrolase (beta-lactamase superfamily II)|nr:MAG: hypothetical protein B6D39_01425 [Anaerolineae bacterium UTCFX2]
MGDLMLDIVQFTLGPVGTNTYLIADTTTGDAAVIDPAWDGAKLARAAADRDYRIRQIWLTHAHFDHLGGTAELAQVVQPSLAVALHSGDLPLWEARGGSELFGFRIDPGPRPSVMLDKETQVKVGSIGFDIRHAPGHTPGHVVFYSSEMKVAFCGDVIFAGSIGRTDLPGGSYNQLIQSIQTQILTMPDDTRLLSGHGPETTVGEERRSNPFLTDLDF